MAKYLVKPFSVILGIYMINLSIDVADLGNEFDPTVNEIESMFELVLEVAMDKGNVLPEQDEPDPESQTCFLGLDYVLPDNPVQLRSPMNFFIPEKATYVFSDYSDPSISIVTPPPKV